MREMMGVPIGKHRWTQFLFGLMRLRSSASICGFSRRLLSAPSWLSRFFTYLLCTNLLCFTFLLDLRPFDTLRAGASTFDFRPPTSNLRPSISPPTPITAGNDWSSQPSISADGRFVAFTSSADNLVEDDTNQVADIFVYDRQLMSTRRVSVSSAGVQANALSSRPAISADGRVVAFESLAGNLVPVDTNGLSDIFVHDLLTGETSRVSVDVNGVEGNGWSEGASISGDGRVVAFVSAAGNLFPGDANAAWDAFTYDRLTGFLQRISLGPNGEDADGETRSVMINPQGTTVTFISSSTNLLDQKADPSPALYSYNRGTFRTVRVAAAQAGDVPSISTGGQWIGYLSPTSLQDQSASIFDQLNQVNTISRFPLPLTQQAISANGQYLYAVGTADGEAFDLYAYAVETGKMVVLIEGVENVRPAVSRDGQVIAFVQQVGGLPQIQVADQRTDPAATYILYGRVRSPFGDPLAQVTVDDGRGHSVQTDQAGLFFFGGLAAGPITLAPSKMGFAFEPDSKALTLQSDKILDEIQFTYVYSDVLQEARLDIGMPYDHRCEEGLACKGNFHGYAAGQCTDLVLDAFIWGADYNIVFALWRDAQAHPEHFYQDSNARDAYDMWRYFAYSGQLLPHDAPYQVGDLVFFDWSDDGEINHVALVSKVDAKNRPVLMIEASDIVAGNPSGLAAELPWQYFHEHAARGHARWNGVYESPVVGLAPKMTLQVGLGSTGANLWLVDLKGGTVSATRKTIPGSSFFDLEWEQNLTVLDPLAHGSSYFVVISNPTQAEMPYYFVAQVAQEWDIYGSMLYMGKLPPGGARLVPLKIMPDGALTTFTWSPRKMRPPR